MKKLISKLKKIKDNAGSGLILVIVALGFIGILTGALLTAVGYVYRLKLYDYNARDNFYYVEQAMNEIYAGIGNKTVGCMQSAYNYTVDNMTYYDINAGSNGAYVTKTNDEANKDFKKKFMAEVYNVFYSAGSNEFVSSLAACITNDTVKLEDYEWKTGGAGGTSYQYLAKKDNRSGITVLMYDKDGNILTGATIDDQMKLDKIVIKNIVLSRTAEYNRSQANGTFTQTLSADIVIAKPDFEVNFNSINADFNTLLDYSIIADMGIDINQYSKLNIAGNIYAGADYYNKWYNYYGTAYTDPTQANADRYYAYDYTIDNNGTEIMTAGTLINNTNDDRYKQSLSPSPKLTFGTNVNNTFSWQSIERHQKYKVDGNGNILVDENGNQLTEDDDAYTARYFMLPVTNKTFGTLDINADYTNRRQDVETGAGGYTYFNTYLHDPAGARVSIQDAKFDGINEHSKYSGLYINGTEVDLVSNMVIVPGTIAVMNSGSLSMYGIESNKIVNSEVWADNVVLGGYSLINPANTKEVIGSSAVFNADLYVRDDLQLDADNSKFVLNGSYYGYGDSTKRDNRRFIPTVDPENFYEATYKKDTYGNYYWYDVNHMRVYEYDGDEDYVDSLGNTVKKGDLVDISASLVSQGKTTSKEGIRVDKAYREQIDEYVLTASDFSQDDYYYEDQYSLSPDTRGHYNSSAIVINGENANLDLSKADTIFIAGRAYVELSKYTDITSTNVTKYTDSSKTSGINYNVDVKSYTYDAAIDDYRTGDSISVKPSQQAYMPPSFVGSPEHTVYTLDAGTTNARRHDYYAAELAYNITYDDSIFSDYFGYDEVNDKIIAPCYKYETFGKTYYYYDFEVAYDMMKNKTDGIIYRNNNDTDPYNNIDNAEDMAEQFIVDYDYASKNDTRLVPHLTKIDDQSENTTFEVGQISLPANSTGDHVYSSGAISAKNNTNFTITTAKNATTSELNELLDRTSGQASLVTGQTSGALSALQLSDDLLKKSQYVKFSLANISKNSAKAAFVDYLIGYHSEADTIANGDTNERILGIKGDDIDNSHSHSGSYSHGGIRGESSITPINTYLNFFKINNNKLIVPKGLKNKYEGSVPEGTTIQEIELGSNNDIYVTSQDITIYPKSADGKVKGIILAKGDVKFDSTVTSFEGLIVSGSKVYITENNNITTIKSNPEAVKAILNELQLVEGAGVREEVTYLMNDSGEYIDYEGNLIPDGESPVIAYQTDGDGNFVTDSNGQRVPITNSVNVGDAEQKALADEVLDLFKAYEDSSTEALASDDRSVNVYDLDYTSVMKYDNWVKNVE